MCAKKVITQYDEKNIKELEGLEGVRKRPTVYINAIGQDGTFHLIVEAIGNVLDEFRAGRGSELMVNVDLKTSTVTVSDDGIGIPVGKIESVFTNLHSSGKFDDKAYGGFSIGLNGIGLKAINALSTKTVVLVKRDGYKHMQEFSEGKVVTKLKKLEATKQTGTTVTFTPDKKVLKDIKIDPERVRAMLEKTSFLNAGLSIKLSIKNEKGSIANYNFKSKRGIPDLFDHMEKTPLVKPMHFSAESEKMEAEIVMSYNVKKDYDDIVSFVNGVETTEHGTHVTGFKMGLTEVIKKFILDNKMVTAKDKFDITGDDVREGVVAVVSVKHKEALFAEQAKKTLTNTDIQGYVKKLIADELTKWMNSNKANAKKIAQHVINCAKGRVAAKRAKTAVVKKSEGILGSISNISKFSAANSNNPEDLEIYLCEGNSAGGSLAEGRDPDYQAVYRLRGKPKNTFSSSQIQVLANKEFLDIISILGCGIGKDFDITKLTHKKIIIIADADVDGSHIVCLLLTFFWKQCPELIRQGHVYIAQPPLYKIKENNKDIYIKNDVEYDKYIVTRATKIFDVITYNPFDKSKAKVSAKSLQKLIANTKFYLSDLNNKASDLASEPELVETLLTYNKVPLLTLKKVLEKQFTECEIIANGKTSLFLSGLINNKYHSLIIDKALLKEINDEVGIDDITDKFYVTSIKGGANKKLTLGELLVAIEDNAVPKTRQRFKGLGEMNAEQLWETTLNPANRIFVKVDVSGDEANIDEQFKILLGDDPDLRKDFFMDFKVSMDDLAIF